MDYSTISIENLRRIREEYIKRLKKIKIVMNNEEMFNSFSKKQKLYLLDKKIDYFIEVQKIDIILKKIGAKQKIQ